MILTWNCEPESRSVLCFIQNLIFCSFSVYFHTFFSEYSVKIHCGAVSIEKDKYMTPAHSLKTTRSSHSAQLLDSRPKGRGFEPHRRHCVVSLSKNINPSLVLVQPRKTRPFITERLLMGTPYLNKNSAKSFCGFFLCCFVFCVVFVFILSKFPNSHSVV